MLVYIASSTGQSQYDLSTEDLGKLENYTPVWGECLAECLWRHYTISDLTSSNFVNNMAFDPSVDLLYMENGVLHSLTMSWQGDPLDDGRDGVFEKTIKHYEIPCDLAEIKKQWDWKQAKQYINDHANIWWEFEGKKERERSRALRRQQFADAEVTAS